MKADFYSIHNSNNPSIIFIAPLLTIDNYDSWSRAVTMALQAKIKHGFVDGILPQPLIKISFQMGNDVMISLGARFSTWFLPRFDPVFFMLMPQHKYGLI